jgi:hypothetical protein
MRDNDLRWNKFRKEDKHSQSMQLWHDAPSWWPRIQESLEMFRDMMTQKMVTEDILEIRDRCLELKELDRIPRIDCRAEWTHHLASAPIVGIGIMLGFGHGKTCALEVIFEDGRRGWFKPCGHNLEWPEMETYASALDWALGWNSVAPVVSRNISVTLMQNLIEKNLIPRGNANPYWDRLLPSVLDRKSYIMRQLVRTCADYHNPDVLFGTMIGWWSEVEDFKTIPKSFKRGITPEKVLEMRKTIEDDWAGELTQNHIFFYLINILRGLGYNEYHLKYGPLIALDLDRTDFSSFSDPITKMSICTLCKIYESTYDRIRELNQNPNHLAQAVERILSYDPERLQFYRQHQTVLKQRLAGIVRCFEECIKKYGYEDVVIRDV